MKEAIGTSLFLLATSLLLIQQESQVRPQPQQGGVLGGIRTYIRKDAVIRAAYFNPGIDFYILYDEQCVPLNEEIDPKELEADYIPLDGMEYPHR